MAAKYALSSDDVRAEFEAVMACWVGLSRLDTKARYRVIQWLSQWVNAEAPEGDKHGGLF